MNLYCITLFLSDEKIREIVSLCEKKHLACKKSVASDQTNAKIGSFQIECGGLRILLLPSNDFHKDDDFEIGLTTATKPEWETLITNLKANFAVEYEKFPDGETEYCIFKDEKSHGNFFFIFDGEKSKSACLEKIECVVSEYDFDFYNEKITKIIGKNLSDKISVQKGEKSFVKRLILKNDEEIILF